MQITIRIGATCLLMLALLCGALWEVHVRGWLPDVRPSVQYVEGAQEPQFMPTNGGVLTIAWVKGYETFERHSPSRLHLGPFQLKMPFGETVSGISTAAKYQYQIRLEKKWPMECSREQCIVRTGPVELAEPVAIYSNETTRRTSSGWARFDKSENLETLNRELDVALAQRGNAPRNRDLGLRAGRAEVARFVRQWMVDQNLGSRNIVVLYPGEDLVDGKPVAVQ